MKKKSKWKNVIKRSVVSGGTILGLAFSVFDPATRPPDEKIAVVFEDESGDDKDKHKDFLIP